MMIIGIFEAEKWEKSYFRRSELKTHKLFFYEEELNKDFIPSESEKIEIISTFIYSKIDKMS